jgi:quercetin dioxygenase-like cupin family protein
MVTGNVMSMQLKGSSLSAEPGATIHLAAQGVNSPDATLAGIKRTDLINERTSVPGRHLIQSRVEFPAGASAARHQHAGEEAVFVLEGTLEYRLDGASPVTLKAGDALLIPYGRPHSVRNAGSGPAVELATYVVEEAKPLVTLVE